MPWVFYMCLVLGLALSACSDDSSSGTSTTDMPDTSVSDTGNATDTGAADSGMVEVDTTPPLEPSTLFGPCVEDSQCPGEGAICRTSGGFGAPGGVCTIPCEDRTPCDFNGVYHFCLAREGETQRYCERRCLNGFDCGRSRYTCQLPQDAEEGVCFGICLTDEDCGDGTRCEPYSGRCVDGEPSTTGAITGEPCEAPEDCRSEFCVVADNGWPEGSCISNCILAPGFNNTNFYSGETLPEEGCPGNAICMPLLGGFARNDYGACVAACNEDTDCREGYACRKTWEGSGGVSTFTNGVCWPAQ